MISIPRLALAALCLTAAAPASAALTPAETRMVRTVDAEQARQLALLEKLVNQNSGTLNSAGVKAVGDMMRAELEPLGFRGRVDRHESGQPRRAYRCAQIRARTRSCC